MAQLRDTVVSGSLRATDSLLATKGYLSNSLTITNTDAIAHLIFSRSNYNYVSIPSGSSLCICGGGVSVEHSGLVVNFTTNSGGVTTGSVYPGVTNKISLGAANLKWSNIYSTKVCDLTLTAAATGFTIAGGTTSKTLTVSNTYTLADACAKSVTDSSSASAISTGTSLPTERDIYYGLPTINNSHAYTSSTTIYAPTGAGTVNYTLVSSGGTSAPTWTNKGNGRVFYGTCASAANAAQKVVVCSQYDALTAGDIMIVTFSNTNTTNTALTMVIQNAASSPTVTTAAKDIKCQIVASISNIPAVGYLVAARPYEFVYDGTYWMLMNVNRDNNDNTYDRTYAAAGTKTAETQANGGVGLHRYSLEMLTVNNKWSSVSTQAPTANTANSDDSAKTKATCAFLLNSPILYQNNDAGAAPGNSCSPDGYTTIPCNLRQCAASSTGWANLTVSLPVYLIGQVQDDKKSFKLKNVTNQPWWTQTLPTTNDGYIYIYLGVAYNTTNIYLHTWHPIYWHDGQNLQLYQGEASYGANLPATGREGQVFYQLSDPWYELPSGGNVGEVLMKHSGADRDVYWGMPVGGYRPDNTVKYYVAGSTLTTQNANAGVFNTNVYVENNVLFGAAWNDYAEYRQCLLPPEPGRCIVENGDGTLSLSSKRLQPGAEIVSDTFGFAIGQNKKCNTPIAVSGRVLAYMDVPRDQIKIGAPVCSGPNGTVSQMTEQEARDYPWLIIGTVSQIPVEAEWGENKVRVNGRVWIRVR